MTNAKDTHAISEREKQAVADRLSDADPADVLDTGAGQVSSPYQNEVQADAIAKQTQKRNEPRD